MNTLGLKTGTLSFALEPLEPFWTEAQPLFEKHYAEVAEDKDLLVLAPNYEYYKRGDEMKMILFVTARCSGALVGYMVWMLYYAPHYRNVLCAQNDMHFLLPEYRRGMNGYRLFKEAIALVRPLGVRYCCIRERIGHEHPAIMKRLGFTERDINYSCVLNGDEPCP